MSTCAEPALAALDRHDPRFRAALTAIVKNNHTAKISLDVLTATQVDDGTDCPHYVALAGLRILEQHQALDSSHQLTVAMRQALLEPQADDATHQGNPDLSPGLNPGVGPGQGKDLQRLPVSERPRERLLRLGGAALSAEELVAILLGTGSNERGVLELARELIIEHDGLLGLANLDNHELQQINGLGPAKIASLSAALEIGRRLGQQGRRERQPLTEPEFVARLLTAELTPLGHEEFWCLPLDARCRLIGEPRRVSRGDVDGTEAGPRNFFRIALKAGAVQAIAAHNHPTGNPGPSSADVTVTKRLQAAGATVDCPLVDHLIIGDKERFYSFRRNQPHLFQ